MTRQIFLRFLRWSNVLLALLTLLVYLAPFVDPEILWPPAILGLFFPWLLLTNLLLLFIWVGFYKWYFLLPLSCILLGWGHLRSIFGFSAGQGSEEISSPALAVMTFNCHGMIGRKGQVITQEEMTSFFRKFQPDVLCLQEFANKPKDLESVSNMVRKATGLEYSFFRRAPNLAIFSKFPISENFSQSFENGSNGFIQTDISVEGRKIRMINMHLQTNSITGIANKVANSGDLKSKQTWLDIRGMLARYRTATRLRVGQTKNILARIKDSPYPVVVCGDMNDVPQSYVYRMLNREMTDTFKAAGRGLGVTYAGKIPGLRIDYIFVSPLFRVQKTEVGSRNFSDHRPVITEISLPASK